MNPRSSQSALRTFIIVLGIAATVVIFAFAFESTDVSLEETREPTRQASLNRAMRELLSPNIFDQDIESQAATTPILLQCDAGEQPVAAAPAANDEPRIVLSAVCGESGDTIVVEGFNFRENVAARLQWIPPNGNSRPLLPVGSELRVFDVDSDGHFTTEVEVPRIRGGAGDIHEIQAETFWRVGSPRLSDTSQNVVEKMLETVFLALMATTFAIPIAFALSFLAARNLMRQVSMPAGTVLVGFLLLPVGWIIGSVLLGAIGNFANDLGSGDLFSNAEAAVIPGFVLFASSIATRATRSKLDEADDLGARVQSIVTNAGILAVSIFIFGLVAGLAITIGEIFDTGFLGIFGRFLVTLGDIMSVLITFVAALSGAFFISSVGVGYSQTVFKKIATFQSHALGTIFGVLAGAVLMGLVAQLGTMGALLGLLAPVVAAVLGAQTTVSLFNWIYGMDRHKHDVSAAAENTRFLLSVISAVAIFIVASFILDMPRAIIEGRQPLQDEFHIFGVALGVQSFIAEAAIIGGLLSGAIGLLNGVHRSIAIGMTIYTTSRAILNVLRSIEPLIMGIVFVIWVGVGPFAGVLALMLHSIAALGKLYSEQIENIDPGPIEALQATGATRLQTIIYAVVPQIIPPYIAFTLYRWDINVRLSTIIGFVGGGGIGFVLQQQINLLQYRDAGVAVLAIAIVVSALDYASATIRERII